MSFWKTKKIKLGVLSATYLRPDISTMIGASPLKLKANVSYLLTDSSINIWPEGKRESSLNPFVHIRILDDKKNVLYHRIVDQWGSENALTMRLGSNNKIIGPFDSETEITLQALSGEHTLWCSMSFTIEEPIKDSSLQDGLKNMLEGKLGDLFKGESWKKGDEDKDTPFGNIPDSFPDDF